MISENNKIEVEKENNTNELLKEIKEKYNKIIDSNIDNNKCTKEINCLNKILENSNAFDKFNNYINNDFLDNCEYKLIFMPEEFNMNEDNKYYFNGLGDKKKKKVNYRNKNNNKNCSVVRRNKRKYD